MNYCTITERFGDERVIGCSAGCNLIWWSDSLRASGNFGTTELEARLINAPAGFALLCILVLLEYAIGMFA